MDYGLLSDNCSSDLLCPGANCPWQDNVDQYGRHYFYGGYQDSVGNMSNLFDACNCSSWHAETYHVTPIAGFRIATSLFSIIGSASIILIVLLTGKLSAAEVHPLFILSVADFILSILWMIGGVVWINPGDDGWARDDSNPHTGMCYVLAIATTMMELVTFMLTMVYALSALLRTREVYHNKGYVLQSNDNKKRFRHVVTVLLYIVSWVLPLITVLPAMESLVGIQSTNQGCWCVLDFYNLRPDDGIYGPSSRFNRFAMVHATIVGIFFIVISLLMMAMYAMTFLYARKVIRQSEASDGNKGDKLIKSILKRLSFYLLVFFISGFPALLASFVVWSEKERLRLDEHIDRVILYIHAMFIPLQGFLNAIVYGWSRKEFRRAMSFADRIQTRKRRSYESLNYHTRHDTPTSYTRPANVGLNISART